MEVARKLAFLPQQQIIPQGLTVQQLVSLGRSPHQCWWQWELSVEDQQQVSIALELTQLKKLGDRPVEQLSGGERQRVQNNRIYVVDYYGFINAGSIDSIQKSCEKLKQILSKTINY